MPAPKDFHGTNGSETFSENALPAYADRFRGTARLYGDQAFARITGARVAVIGLGGVGSWAAEALARSGVGALTLVDLDDICLNNINRQIQADEKSVGQLKCMALKNRIHSYHPRCQVVSTVDFFTDDTAAQILTSDLDVVVDAIDSVKNKALLLAKCLSKHIPVVTAGGAGGRSDPTRLRVAPLSRSHDDALLRNVRRVLRKDHGLQNTLMQNIPCVFSTEPTRFPWLQNAIAEEAVLDQSSSWHPSAESRSLRLDCSTGFGTVIHVTASMGMMLSHLALEALIHP